MTPFSHPAHRRDTLPVLLAVATAAGFMPQAAFAYVGPGAGLTAIGTMIALIAALLLAVVGFVWYPLKRMLRARKGNANTPKAAPVKDR